MPQSTREQKTLLTPFSLCFPHIVLVRRATIDAYADALHKSFRIVAARMKMVMMTVELGYNDN